MNDRVALETRTGQRVLVTGGAGFLGSYVCERLVMEGASVTCIDSLLTGRKLNVADLKASGRYRRSCSGRCRSTIRTSASPTSRWPRPSSAGGRASISTKACAGPSTISAVNCGSSRCCA